MNVMKYIFIIIAAASLASCSSIRGSTIDVGLIGELKFEPSDQMSTRVLAVKFSPINKAPGQLSPFDPLQAEINGTLVKVHISTVVVSVLFEKIDDSDFQLNPSAGLMASNFVESPKPLACSNPASIGNDEVLRISRSRNISIEKADQLAKEARTSLQSQKFVRPVIGMPWRYFCGGPIYYSIFPSGYIFNFDHAKQTAVEKEASGIGNIFYLSMPAIIQGVHGNLVMELRSNAAKFRYTYY